MKRLVWLTSAWSAVALAEEDIRDIRGPKAVTPAASWWWLCLVLLGVLAIGYVIWRRRRTVARPRRLTLTEQTLQRLDGTRPLMQPATAREFGIAASEVIRTYIEKRFNVVATQRTTEEFLQALLSHTALAPHRALLASFLEQCDFVKFAGASLAVADMEALLQSARTFVLQTGA